MDYVEILNIFIEHYKKEVEIIQDNRLLEELQLLEGLRGNDVPRIFPPSTPYRIGQVPPPAVAKSNITTSDYNHTHQYLSKIEAGLQKISTTKEPLPEPSNTVEVCFLMDCTGSMGSYIKMCQEKITQIVDIICSDNPNTSILISFVGYREHKDHSPSVLSFNADVSSVKSFISTVKPLGGKDIPEDVCGGLNLAINLDWKTRHRLLILIADAPCHGKMYHSEGDDYPDGDPLGFIPEVQLSQATNKNIHIFFARLKKETDQMTSLWEKHMRNYDSAFPLTIFSIADDSDFIANITDAITTILMSD